MYSALFWLLALTGFVAQILCCIYAKTKFVRYAPMMALGGAMVATLVLGVGAGGFGLVACFVLVWQEAKALAVTALGWGLWALVNYAKK